MRRVRDLSTVLWALGVAIAAVIVARATYTADLSAFLPRTPTATEQLLVEQLRAGPAARLIIAAIEGGNPQIRAHLSARLASQLRSDRAFVSVENGDEAGLKRDRDYLFRNRYLLSANITPERFTVAGLHSAISDSLDLLASSEGPLVKPLFARDPTGEFLALIESLGAARAPHLLEGVWSSPNGAHALLVLETSAAGSDTDGQQAACAHLAQAFASALAALPEKERPGVKLRMSGPPVYAVAARATIHGEVVRLSAVSALLVTLLLLSVYRSGRLLLLGLVPVASGALAGIAAVALKFGAVHGLTLGFGVTLIGEAVDYSIYLFLQSVADFRSKVWPTLRLGMLTSVCGFAALLPSAFPGIQQLGLYSIVGLLTAALVTRFVLPTWLPPGLAIRDLSGPGAVLARALPRLQAARVALALVPLLAGLALYQHRGALFDRELTSLSPLPSESQALDEQLRAESGAPDVGYLVVAQARGREGALAAAQLLTGSLQGLADAGVIGGFQSPTRYQPPLALERSRQASLPEPAELKARLDSALVGLPLHSAVLEPFLLDAERARTAPPLTRADLEGTSFAPVVDALLIRGEGGGWSALLPVSAAGAPDLTDAEVSRLRATVEGETLAHASLLDLKAEADRLYQGYLSETVRLALVGFAAIVILLALALRSSERVVRVVLPLALAVLAVAGTLVGAGVKLSILHVIGMLLIVAIGSNYALFFDRASRPGHGSVPRTLASVLVANLGTVLTFGVLATSSVPLIADLGRTVAPGTLLALFFSAVLAKPFTCAGDAVTGRQA